MHSTLKRSVVVSDQSQPAAIAPPVLVFRRGTLHSSRNTSSSSSKCCDALTEGGRGGPALSPTASIADFMKGPSPPVSAAT